MSELHVLLTICRVLGANGLTCPAGHGEVSTYHVAGWLPEKHPIGYCWVCEKMWWLLGKWKGQWTSIYGGIPFESEWHKEQRLKWANSQLPSSA